MVNKYRGNNSSVLMCFIDASKAFDRVNHRKLFVKLNQRGVQIHCENSGLLVWPPDYASKMGQ